MTDIIAASGECQESFVRAHDIGTKPFSELTELGVGYVFLDARLAACVWKMARAELGWRTTLAGDTAADDMLLLAG